MSSLSNPGKWLLDFFRGVNSDDEEQRLTAEACLRYAPVWNAVSKIAADVGQLPLVCNKRLKKGGAEYATDHPAFRCMKSRPNDYQSAMVFKQTAMASALLYGNFRAVIDRTNPRRFMLWPLSIDAATYMIDGEKWHISKRNPADPTTVQQAVELKLSDKLFAWRDDNILHIPGLSLDGISGLKLSDFASRSFGLGLSAEKQQSQQTKKGFSGSLFLEAPIGQMTQKKDAEEFLAAFKEAHAGAENSGSIGLLRNGVKANAVALSSRDQQALESRQFQRGDVGLWFLLEQIMGDTGNSYASAVQKNISYLQNCLGRWLKTWEEECDEKLLSDKEKDKDTHFFKFNTGALLRTDLQTTATTISTLRTAMVLTANEARDLLDYNPVEGGDTLENPATTATDNGNRNPEDNPPPANAKSAIVSRVKHMIAVECKRLVNGTTAKNYTDWAESFYEGWQVKLAEVIEEIGGNPAISSEYCTESRDKLFHLLGYATQETLKKEVENLVAKWPERANGLAEKIINGGLVNV
jgi:HK97 family phage portal protein